MAANTNPIFVSVPNANPASISVSLTNASRVGSSASMVSLISGGTNGTRIEGVIFTALEATTSGCILIYESTSGGASPSASALILVGEVQISSGTSSTTVVGFTSAWTPAVTPFTLASGNYLWYAVTVNKKFSAKPIAGDF